MTNLIRKKVTVKKGAGNFHFGCDFKDAAYLIITEKKDKGKYYYDAYDKEGNKIGSCGGHDLTESDFIPYKRDITTLEQGDVIVHEDGRKTKILGICGKVLHLSFTHNLDSYSFTTDIKGLIEDGYTLEGQEETVEEIVIDGKRYDKKEVEERIKELKSL